MTRERQDSYIHPRKRLLADHQGCQTSYVIYKLFISKPLETRKTKRTMKLRRGRHRRENRSLIRERGQEEQFARFRAYRGIYRNVTSCSVDGGIRGIGGLDVTECLRKRLW